MDTLRRAARRRRLDLIMVLNQRAHGGTAGIAQHDAISPAQHDAIGGAGGLRASRPDRRIDAVTELRQVHRVRQVRIRAVTDAVPAQQSLRLGLKAKLMQSERVRLAQDAKLLDETLAHLMREAIMADEWYSVACPVKETLAHKLRHVCLALTRGQPVRVVLLE